MSLAHDNKNTQPDREADESLFSELDGFADSSEEMQDMVSLDNEISLESILAEYKGTAYIDGDKKTPSSVLQEKTNQIVLEVTGSMPKPSQLPAQNSKSNENAKEESKESLKKNVKAKTAILTIPEEPAMAKGADSLTPKENISAERVRIREKDVIALKKYRNPDGDEKNPHSAEVNRAIEKQSQLEEETKKSVRKVFGLFNRNSVGTDDDEYTEEPEDVPEQPEPLHEEENIEEPDFKLAMKRFAAGCNRYSMRSFASLVLSIIMAIITLAFQSDVNLPFGIGNNKVALTGILLIILFIVMILSIDKLLVGFTDFYKKGPGIESLNLISCLLTAASAAYNIITKDTSGGMPYCVISAFTLTFTLWGEKIYYRALTETMKTVLSVAAPSGVIAEICQDLDKTVIKKVSGRTAGFYNNLIQADISEIIYKYATPLLIVSAVVLGFYASVGHGMVQHLLHNIAAVMAAAAPFSALLAFAIPFNTVARRTRKSGAAVAGWGGADDLYHSDGASITDEDLFPSGTLTLGAVKIFEEVSPEKAMRYTASLIVASNSGLTKLFLEHLSKNAMNLVKVEEFSCYEGGIGATIRNERVISGSAAFMNLMGIRIPSTLNMKNAIFTAINKKLIAVFAINYVPVKSVQNALISILRYRVKLFFAVRDFNITPVMLEQKFKVSVEDIEYIPIRDSYDISDDTKQEAKRVSAILTREGLGPFVESITGGRRLRTISLIATVFSVISAVFGMLLMFTICWSGAYASASAGNLLLYMMSMLLVDVIIAGFAKYRQ